MNQEDVWKTVKEDLRVEMSPGAFNALIAQSSLTELAESGDRFTATIAAFSPWHQRMLEERHWGQLQGAFERVTGKSCELHFTHSSKIERQSLATLGPLFIQEEDGHTSYLRAAHRARLRADFTFEQFAVSSSNEMAYAAAQAVSRTPGQAYHLLFLFGGVGVGKTHLMQGIGHRILEKNPDTRVIYCTGEEFTNEIIEAIRDKSTAGFRKKYRHVHVLLIDDIQFIGGKDKVQEEFFHTFNTIHQEGGQIVLTSDQLPHEISGLEDRLRSRFEGGLTIDIQQPSFELRTAILLIKAKGWGIDLPMDAAQLVAANIESTRLLEGLLRRLVAESAARNEPVSKEMADQVLKSTKRQGGNGEIVSPKNVNTAVILSAVAEVFSLKVTQLKGKRRKREIVLPRHLAMYLLRTDAGLPFEDVGVIMGGRDHTTALHAVEKITNDLPRNERLRNALADVRSRLS